MNRYSSNISYKINGKIIPKHQVLGYLKNRNMIEINKLYEDKLQEDKIWYDDGNDYVFRPRVKGKNIEKALKYFNIEYERIG